MLLRSVISLFQSTPLSFTAGTSVNLVRAAQCLIELLDRVHHYPSLYSNVSVLKRALYRYEHIWIPLLASTASHQRIGLVPPIDVHWVWLCHMLCPARYGPDSALMCSAAGFPDMGTSQTHILDHALLSSGDYRRAARFTERLWAQHSKTEPYDLHDYLERATCIETKSKTADESASISSFHKTKSHITYDIIAASSRQMSFHYQVAILPQYRDSHYIELAVSRYIKFLQLMRDFPGQIWIPTFDIDLIWHSHMLHPCHYASDTKRMCRRLVTHDDTINDRSDGSDYSGYWQSTVITWKKQFGEPLLIPGGVWRGNPAIDELDLRALSSRLIADVGRRIESRQHRRSGMLVSRGRSIVSFKTLAATPLLSANGRRRWSNVDWLHSQNYKNALMDVETSKKANAAVERWSVLQSATTDGGDKLLSCRVVLPRTCFHRKRDVCTQCAFVEMFSNSTQETNWLPLCSAHFLPHLSLCIGDGLYRHLCTKMPEEQMMLIRVCGEDFAVLGARWESSMRGERSSRKRSSYLEADRSKRMALRLWLLRRGAAARWIDLTDNGSGQREGLAYRFTIGDDRYSAEVCFDLKTAILSLMIKGNVNSMGHLLVSSQAIATAAALLLAELRSSDDKFQLTKCVGGGEMVALVGGDLLTAPRVEEC